MWYIARIWNPSTTTDLRSLTFKKPKLPKNLTKKEKIKIQTICILVMLNNKLLQLKNKKNLKVNFPPNDEIKEIYLDWYEKEKDNLLNSIKNILKYLDTIDIKIEIEKIISYMGYAEKLIQTILSLINIMNVNEQVKWHTDTIINHKP